MLLPCTWADLKSTKMASLALVVNLERALGESEAGSGSTREDPAVRATHLSAARSQKTYVDARVHKAFFACQARAYFPTLTAPWKLRCE